MMILLYILFIPLYFIPLINFIALYLPLYYFFHKMLNYDVSSTILSKEEYEKIYSKSSSAFRVRTLLLYFISTIPFVTLFVSIFYIIFLSHAYFIELEKLKKIENANEQVKKALQVLTLNPDNFKIVKNEFIDPITNRIFIANYQKFSSIDSVFAPRLVNIDIVAEKKAKLKIEYVRIEKNIPQKVNLNIPKSYDSIEIKKK